MSACGSDALHRALAGATHHRPSALFLEMATFPSDERRDAAGQDDAWLTDRPPLPLPEPFALRPSARPRRAVH